MATRRERVILDLEDNFSSPMARAAASAALLNSELDKTNRSSERASRSTDSTAKATERAAKATKEYTAETALADEKAARLRKTLRDEAKAALDAEAGLNKLTDSSGRSEKQIDKLSGRLALFAQAAAIVGPALVPIGAAAVPALVGLTTQMGLAGVAAGVTVLAFHGVGESLKALNAYDLEPSAANFEKLQESMRGLGPAARDFVRYLHSIGPELSTLRVAAQDGVLPGAEDGIKSLMRLAPRAEDIISRVATTVGSLLAEAGDSLAGPKWAAFFNYLRTDAAPILTEMGHTLGNFVQGLGSMLVAFGPLTASFSSGFESMSESFAGWAANLSSTNGFQDFIQYVQTSGPQVLDLLGSLSHLLIGLATAAAPVGAVVLPLLTSLVEVLASIVDSPVGPPLVAAAAGFAAVSRAVALYEVAKGTQMVAMLTAAGPAGVAAGAGMSAAAAGALVFAGAFAGDWLMKQSNANVGITTMTANLQKMADTGQTTATLDHLGFSVDSLGEKLHRAAYTDDLFGFSHQKDDIRDMDVALTKLDPGKAAAAFEVIKTQAAAAGVSMSDLADLFPKYAAQVGGMGGVMNSVGGIITGFVGTASKMGPAFASASQSAESFATAVARINEVLSKRATARDYQAALDDFTKSLKDNGRTLDTTTAKGRANQAALDNIAGSALKTAQNLRGMNRIQFLSNARERFLAAAKAAGMTGVAAGKLATKLGLIPKSVATKLILNGAGSAESKMKQLAKLYNLTPRQVKTLISQAGADPSMAKVKRLAATYHMTPKQVLTILAANDLASAKSRAARSTAEKLQRKYLASLIAHDGSSSVVRAAMGVLASFDGRRANAYITTHHTDTYTVNRRVNVTAGKPRAGSADGNLFVGGRPRAFAGGGFTDDGTYVPRVPQIRQGGGNVLWSEPETGWEAYISGKPGMEDRNLAIWREAGDRLGARFEEYANGGVKAYANGGGGGRSGSHRESPAAKRREREREAAHKKHMSRIKEVNGELSKMKGKLKDTKAARKEYASTVAGAYISDPFGGTLGGFDAQTRYETTRLQGVHADLLSLKKLGLDGALLKDLAASGNASLVDQFAHLTKAQIADRERAYGTRNSLSTQVGNTAATQVYGKEINHLTSEVKQLTRELHRLRKGGHVGNVHHHNAGSKKPAQRRNRKVRHS